MRKKRLGISGLLVLAIIASLSFMVIPAWLPFLRKGWVLLSLATVIIAFSWRNYISSQAFLSLLVYEVVVIINSLSGDTYFGSWTTAIHEALILFVPSSLALYCTRGGDMKFVKTLLLITFIALTSEMVASFIVLEANPGIVRGLYLQSQEEGGINFMYSFYKMGILDYFMGHAIPILIAPLFCLYKEAPRKNKPIYIFIIVVCIVLTWLSESATAILLMVLMVLLGIIINSRHSFKSNVIIISIAMLIAAVMLSSVVMSGILDFFIRLLGDDSILGERLAELQLSLYEDQLTGDLQARIDLYGQSLGFFSNGNILFGGNDMPGRHSGLLDRLAALGLIGFIPLLLFLYFSLKVVWNSLTDNHKIYYLQSILGAILMLFFKSAWVWPIFFALYILSPSLLVVNTNEK